MIFRPWSAPCPTARPPRWWPAPAGRSPLKAPVSNSRHSSSTNSTAPMKAEWQDCIRTNRPSSREPMVRALQTAQWQTCSPVPELQGLNTGSWDQGSGAQLVGAVWSQAWTGHQNTNRLDWIWRGGQDQQDLPAPSLTWQGTTISHRLLLDPPIKWHHVGECHPSTLATLGGPLQEPVHPRRNPHGCPRHPQLWMQGPYLNRFALVPSHQPMRVWGVISRTTATVAQGNTHLTFCPRVTTLCQGSTLTLIS